MGVDRMSNIQIGFSKADITPPSGIVFGGYAGYRPCGGAHDPLYCKTVVLEQEGLRYCLISMDLVCIDEGLYRRIAKEVSGLGIDSHRLIVSAIHTHAAPHGVISGEGPLAKVNCSEQESTPDFLAYMNDIIYKAVTTCKNAIATLEPFLVRTAKGTTPPVGCERHTGDTPGGNLTVIQCKTESEKLLTLYNFPCHPTVLGPDNVLASADFVAGIENLLDCDMAIFLNGAAGDISTRFTRQESSFDECVRMGQIAANHVSAALEGLPFTQPEPLKGIHAMITLPPRPVEPIDTAQAKLQARTDEWKAAEATGADATKLRLLKTYVEGAWVNLEFAKSMAHIKKLELPITVFSFAGLEFATIPGELFSTLQPEGLSIIAYTNGYFRYICPKEAYVANIYEAMAAIVNHGGGEHLMQEIQQLRRQLQDKH